MEASEEEWVNTQNNKVEGRTLCHHSIASIVFGVNPLFLEGLQILILKINEINKIITLQKRILFWHNFSIIQLRYNFIYI